MRAFIDAYVESPVMLVGVPDGLVVAKCIVCPESPVQMIDSGKPVAEEA